MTLQTWDPDFKNAGITLASSDAIASTLDSGAALIGVRAALAQSEGKVVIAIKATDAYAAEGGGGTRWGLCRPEEDIRTNANGVLDGVSFHFGSENDIPNLLMAQDDIAAVAVDFASGKVWPYTTASGWIGDPAGGTGQWYTIPADQTMHFWGALWAEGVNPSALEIVEPPDVPAGFTKWGEPASSPAPVATIVLQSGYSASIAGNVVSITKDA